MFSYIYFFISNVFIEKIFQKVLKNSFYIALNNCYDFFIDDYYFKYIK